VKAKTIAALIAYMACVPGANWMINNVGTEAFPGGPHTIPVGFGFTAPSGVLLIGVALAARDAVQRQAGYRWAVAAIAVGVALSYLVNPAVATASAAAFLLGELLDLAIYTPLSKRNLPVAVTVSGIAGGGVDTLVFLWIAFGSFQFWQGQVIGKTLVALACGLIVWMWRAVSVRLTPCEA